MWSVFYEYKRAYNLDDTQGYLKSIPKVSQKGERAKSPTSTAISFDEHHEKRKRAEERLAKVDEEQRMRFEEMKKNQPVPEKTEAQKKRQEEFLALGGRSDLIPTLIQPKAIEKAPSVWDDGQPMYEQDIEDEGLWNT